MNASLATCCASLLLVGASSFSQAQEWTRFRGPNGTGISDTKSIPVQWTESQVNWKIALPGAGHSSPVLWGDKLFLTSGREADGGMIILAVNALNGKTLWQKEVPFPAHHLHKFNSFASSSPAVDQDRIYVAWTTPDHYSVRALTHDGETVWERDLGSYTSQHGGGASPMVYEGKVILGNEQRGTSFVIALDAKTGQMVWQTPRESNAAAYATPCVFQGKDGKPVLLFTSQAHGIYALDPESGKVVWEYKEAFDKRSVSSPVLAAGGLIIGTCGSGAGGNYVVALKPPATPGGQPEVAYQIKRSAPYVPTSVAVGDLLFLWSDGGIVTCLHAPTGEIKYSERVGGNYFGSPVCVNGKIYCISSAGDVVVIEASDQFRILAKNPLDELSHSTPAVAGGRMYLRTEKHLLSVGGSPGGATL